MVLIAALVVVFFWRTRYLARPSRQPGSKIFNIYKLSIDEIHLDKYTFPINMGNMFITRIRTWNRPWLFAKAHSLTYLRAPSRLTNSLGGVLT